MLYVVVSWSKLRVLQMVRHAMRSNGNVETAVCAVGVVWSGMWSNAFNLSAIAH